MKERKDKIKNVAIIFLIIMLLLTFFSNTIMNYSLVEVSTQMVSDGKITSKVRGSGTVEASETYAVTISESRKIATVEVKTGDTVQTGDTLFTLEDAKSSELQEAEKSLASLKKDYETAALQSGLTISELEAIEQGTTTSLKDKMNQLSSLQAAVDNAEAAVTAAQAKVNDLETRKTAAEGATVDTSAEQKALDDANSAKTDAENKVSLLTIDVENNKYNSYTDDQISALKGDEKKAYKKFLELKNELTQAKKDLENCETAVTKATAALESKKESGDSSNTSEVNSISNQLTTANQELTAAQKAQEDAEAALKEISEGQVTEVTLASQYNDILEQQKVVDDLQDKSIDAAQVLKQVGLEDRMNNFPAQLSGGEQQRVSIARALAKSPKLLLCDEPTGALDYNTGKTILKLLQDTCREKGMTVVVITHNQAITPMADRVIKIKNSKVAKISLNPNPTPVENIEW